MWDLGRLDEGLERMNRSFELLSNEEPDADLATLAAQLGRFMFFGGQPVLAMQRIESALDMAESLVLPEVLAQALTTKGILLNVQGRQEEGLALQQFALGVALEHDKPSAALRASYNLADSLARADRYTASTEAVRNGLAHARRVGNRYWELSFLGQLYPFIALGEWDEALAMFEELPLEEWTGSRQAYSVDAAHPGNHATASAASWTSCGLLLDRFAPMDRSGDEQERSSYRAGAGAAPACQRRSDGGAGVGGGRGVRVARPLRIRGGTGQGGIRKRL